MKSVTIYKNTTQCFQRKHPRRRQIYPISQSRNVQKMHWKCCVHWICPCREIKKRFHILRIEVGEGFIKLTCVVSQFHIESRSILSPVVNLFSQGYLSCFWYRLPFSIKTSISLSNSWWCGACVCALRVHCYLFCFWYRTCVW